MLGSYAEAVMLAAAIRADRNRRRPHAACPCVLRPSSTPAERAVVGRRPTPRLSRPCLWDGQLTPWTRAEHLKDTHPGYPVAFTHVDRAARGELQVLP